MVTYRIRGIKRYLLAAITFGIVGFVFLLSDIAKLLGGKQSLTIVFSSGMVILAVLLYKMYKIGKKTGVDILGEPEYNKYGEEKLISKHQQNYLEKEKLLQPRNKKILELYVSYMFTWIGAGFAHIGLVTNIPVAAILGSLFFVLALPLFITSLRYYFNPIEKNIKAVSKATNFLVIIAIIMGVSPIFVLIAGLYMSGYYVAFFIILAIIIGVGWLIIRAQIKKKKEDGKKNT